MVTCRFRTKQEYINDVYKSPEDRYLCRNVDRMESQDRMQSDRFIGETDCENCPFREE